ncbi:FadR family transcriptional regulator [Oceanobacillus caeni]|uniref:FadR/GntR family transcriptional regulator n=1 Tax=Oceanobacillus caeni TaxID=405946 RepID=UPI0019564CA8|nr:FadR/GntR family transcriptional regulator [Oceanobacillus caeni]MBU8792188.1 FadR family transcriptional regulator [Oceanobacillus caeni]MCR1835756.1 FadR family transcriptional regulator [Oceanobacillus caeni]
MEYKKIRKRKIYEEVADSLIEMIKNKQLKPGDKLDSVEKLANHFDVGRSAIREALSGLRSMELLEMRQGEGTYVKDFDPSRFTLPVTTAFLMKKNDVKELYELRKILEVGTASLAAKVYKEEDLMPIEKALIVMKNAKDNDELAASADTDFHMAIASATHNQLLINLMSSVSDLLTESIRETRKVLLYSQGRSEKLYLEHERIFNALKDRDSELAGQCMHDHLEEVNKDLFKHIDKW